MIVLSLLYTAITIILALIDAVRIKASWGKTTNINHKVSFLLGMLSAASLIGYKVLPYSQWTWSIVLQVFLLAAAIIAIRWLIYSPALNFWRIVTKTNPSMRLDYESTTTSSAVDRDLVHLSFWQNRALALAIWLILFIIYHLIFE